MIKVKICGITNEEDAQTAVSLGAWALGFVFYRKSPRYLDPSRAGKIISKLPKSVIPVGVFVNPTLDEARQIIQETGIRTVQLHGDETAQDCLLMGVPVFKAFRPETEQDLRAIENYRQVESVLIDAAVPGAWGGTGVRSNWQLAKMASRNHNVILSGGLNADNIHLAISEVRPQAVDVSSGVEAYPGKKCQMKMEEFFRALKSTAVPMEG